jgi:hypothetical protein
MIKSACYLFLLAFFAHSLLLAADTKENFHVVLATKINEYQGYHSGRPGIVAVASEDSVISHDSIVFTFDATLSRDRSPKNPTKVMFTIKPIVYVGTKHSFVELHQNTTTVDPYDEYELLNHNRLFLLSNQNYIKDTLPLFRGAGILDHALEGVFLVKSTTPSTWPAPERLDFQLQFRYRSIEDGEYTEQSEIIDCSLSIGESIYVDVNNFGTNTRVQLTLDDIATDPVTDNRVLFLKRANQDRVYAKRLTREFVCEQGSQDIYVRTPR